MFFSKVFASSALVLALTLGAHAHAGVNPALGVNGNMARSDVKRPNNNCGGANVAASIDQSTPVQAAADGTFTATAVNFNGGADGSRQFTATVDPTGQGSGFNGNVQITQNGNPAPNGNGNDQLVAKLPAGTTCTGGAAGNRCLVSFKSSAGFGNCVVVQQGAGGAAAGGNNNNAAGNNNNGAATNNGNNGAAAGGNNANNNAANTGNNGRGRGRGRGRNGANRAQLAAGSRAPRALLAELEARGEEAVQVVKRGVMSWMWA
ncbi:hypothetical protein VNI00_005363 [Paramarasmius palmivorus]|uniref:Gas1-like protein n=1 Tax=Paramarasmius palmivorus TaxID=297713 RepID=A0AAW0DBH1_9AGAR